MTDLKDKNQVITRIEEEILRVEEEIHRIANKLNNDGFISRVPAAMIEKEQKKMAKYEEHRNKLQEKMRCLNG